MAAVTIRVNAGAIIYRLRQGTLEILLVHQSDKAKHQWSIPKGAVGANEEFGVAARRELAEEADLYIAQLDFLGYIDYGNTGKRLYCYSGQCPPEAQVRARQPEIDAAGFFDVYTAKKMVDKKQRTLINALQKILVFSKFRHSHNGQDKS